MYFISNPNLFDSAKTGKLIVLDLPEGLYRYIENERTRGKKCILLSF